ncbi:MAG: hypothetical protein A4E63_02527 [Syntrophorhabdus sp. PtaU1.Bin050]|nr:MAG: hypothetical protein A4E63_02527 [Syntrophorhabdus sp. PtaU1.Bin050]
MIKTVMGFADKNLVAKEGTGCYLIEDRWACDGFTCLSLLTTTTNHER